MLITTLGCGTALKPLPGFWPGPIVLKAVQNKKYMGSCLPPPSHGQECKEPVVALCGGNKNDTCNLNKIVLCLSQGKFLEDEYKQWNGFGRIEGNLPTWEAAWKKL